MMVDLTKCAPASDTTTQAARGGLKINTYWIMEDGTLSFSDERATVGPVGAPTFQSPSGDPIWQSVRYNVNPDQTISVATEIFFCLTLVGCRPTVTTPAPSIKASSSTLSATSVTTQLSARHRLCGIASCCARRTLCRKCLVVHEAVRTAVRRNEPSQFRTARRDS
ncbi:hypothetical protein BN2475_140088 [Paraburkholderia ribeironis]|uniref:Uncharacterized protein n=1 Tax=Paraburkholderia ribeironis TaxID=1247936 RepID=A0A1N7RT12_9BURK|nr:hypothetical protein BN2475_140088 [Paraburkholderia ribeironis]